MDAVIFMKNKRKVGALAIIKQKAAEKKRLTKNQKSILADEQVIREKQNLYETCGRSVWSAKSMFEYILNEGLETDIEIDDNIIVEIEPNTLRIEQDIISFQLSKMRDVMLPAKKKLGTSKEDIKLETDEYIGNFVSVLYDDKNSVFMIQSNMYGVSIGQIEKYLTELRRKVISYRGSDEIKELACEMSVIVDTCDLDNIRGSQSVKKMRVRAADSVFNNISGGKGNYLAGIRKSFGEKSGMVIDITISIDRDTELKSLDLDLVEGVLDNFEQIEENRDDPNLLVEITRKENEGTNTEVLNLLRPKMSDTITMRMYPRTSIVHEWLLDVMKERYKMRKKKINSILGE